MHGMILWLVLIVTMIQVPFTTFIAYEYTGTGPESEMLHRNVVFKNVAVPDMPFSRLDSDDPEDLWAWMDNNRAEGIESLAIPHNF